MSWSVSALGPADAVLKSITKQFDESTPCQEPEESVRQAVKAALAASLAAEIPANNTVSVRAFGTMSRWSSQGGNAPTDQQSTFEVKIERVFNLVTE
jgi:hypothetical protein